MMYDREKSDPAIVAVKLTNKAGQPTAELVEPRVGAEGNVNQQSKEAKTAVETWRDLSLREASRNIQGIDMSWLGRATRRGIWRDPVHLPKVAEIAVAKPPAPSVIAELDSAHADETSGVQLADDNPTELMQKLLTVVERYPLLRNRL